MMIETSNKSKYLVNYKRVDEKLILTFKSKLFIYVVLKEVWEELKAAMFISYPIFDGLG